MASSDSQVKTSKAGITAHIIVSILYVALGICLLTLDATLISNIVYSFSVMAMSILFICFGAYYMINYFFNKEYVHVSNYGFTMGVILVIIGAVFIFKADTISSFIDALVAIIGVVLGAVMLQQAFALFHIQRSSWFISLLLGLASIGVCIYILLTPFKFFDGSLEGAILLIVLGGLSLFSLLLMFIGLHDHKKDSDRLYKRNVEDAPTAVKDEDSMFEEDEPFVPAPEPEPVPETKTKNMDPNALFEE